MFHSRVKETDYYTTYFKSAKSLLEKIYFHKKYIDYIKIHF